VMPVVPKRDAENISDETEQDLSESA
jgi:hypothetical protein